MHYVNNLTPLYIMWRNPSMIKHILSDSISIYYSIFISISHFNNYIYLNALNTLVMHVQMLNACTNFDCFIACFRCSSSTVMFQMFEFHSSEVFVVVLFGERSLHNKQFKFSYLHHLF
mgnify:CR=1 FL=1